MGAIAANKAATGSGTSATITSLTATAGNALIVGGAAFMGSTSSTTFTVTRTGDTYTSDTSVVYNSGGNRNASGIASAPNVAAAANNLVATFTSGNGVSVFAVEWNGMPTSSILDATPPAGAMGSGTTATSNALTNATATAVYFGINGSGSGSNPATETVGGGWTDTVGGTTCTFTNGSSQQVAGFAWLEVASAASRTASWTVSSAEWTACISVYKLSGGGGAQDTPELYGRPYGQHGQSQMQQVLAQ